MRLRHRTSGIVDKQVINDSQYRFMNKPLAEPVRFWPSIALPIVVSFAVFATLNSMFWDFVQLQMTSPPGELPVTPLTTLFTKVLPGPMIVYLGSSLVALFCVRRAMKRGRLTCRNLGLALTGWTAPKRLLALALIGFCCYYNITRIEIPELADPAEAATATGTALPDAEDTGPEPRSAESAPAAETGSESASAEGPSASSTSIIPQLADDPQTPFQETVEEIGPPPTHVAWGDYCFWFIFLLSASLTELLVFVSVGFCLSEKYLLSRGTHPSVAAVLAGIFASVSFGLYHYTYPSFWWSYVYYPLMPVMMVNIALFVATRNIYLTFILHNMFASIGFTEKQYENYPFSPGFDPAQFQNAMMLVPVFISFALPFLYMHLLERFDDGSANNNS